MTKQKDFELLKEYVQEALLNEDIHTTPGAAGAALRGAVSGAWEKSFGKGGGATGAVAAGLAKTGAAAKSLAKTALAAGADVLTLGALPANYDKIHGEYLDSLKDIEKKYGEDKKRLDDVFGKNLSSLQVAAFFANPLAIPAIKFADEKIKKGVEKATAAALKSGASEAFKKEVDEYYNKINNQLNSAREASKRLRSDQTSTKQTTSGTPAKPEASSTTDKQNLVKNLQSLRKKVEEENNKFSDKNPLSAKNSAVIKEIDRILQSIK